MLSPEELQRCIALIGDTAAAKHNGKFSFLARDPFFMELMARPAMLDILRSLVGDWLRFDHAFGIKMTKAEPISENTHGGPLQSQRSFSYQWVPAYDSRSGMQSMHNGLLKVMYALNDVNPGDGGFICVPGSHKGNVFYRPPHDSHLIVAPQLKAGDALIFTEALVHGSRQWAGEHTRRALIYSYAPGYLAWKRYETIEPYLALATTDLQRLLLRPPYVAEYDEHEAQRTGQWPPPGRSIDRAPIPLSEDAAARRLDQR
jgi:ectoine hydroxylase-related dioxygenase (phytanoyl-CoA dioxygenase family)